MRNQTFASIVTAFVAIHVLGVTQAWKTTMTMTMKTPTKVRVELFFKTTKELQDRVSMLASRGVSRYNLVNKDSKDTPLEWMRHIHMVQPNARVSMHYSLKYQKVPRGTPREQCDKLCQFLDTLPPPASNDKDYGDGEGSSSSNAEVLLISGSTFTKSWNSVVALEALKDRYCVSGGTKGQYRKVAVAFNPFLPSPLDRKQEYQRLKEKLATGLVSKIYLQFGTDIKLLQEGLDFIQDCNTAVVSKEQEEKAKDNDKGDDGSVSIAASIFLPTKQLIAQQKFRPWKGVVLSDEFLSGPEAATKIVLQIMDLYRHKHNVGELLFEAPGVRTTKDMDLVDQLLKMSSRSSGSGNGQVTEEGEQRKDVPASPKRQEKVNYSLKKNIKTDSPASSHEISLETLEVKNAPDLPEEQQPATEATFQKPLAKTKKRTAIIVFGTHDLRLSDNQAVDLAIAGHQQVLPIFLWNIKEHASISSRWGVRGAAEVVCKDALRHLSMELEQFDLPLLCRNTMDPVGELCAICEEIGGADAVYFNREFTPHGRVIEQQRIDALTELDIQVFPCQSSLLYDIERVDLRKGFNGGHWGTLMPFLKACKQQLGQPRRPYSWQATSKRLELISPPLLIPKGCKVGELRMAIMPLKIKWDEPILERFPMNRRRACERLDTFMTLGLKLYESGRSRADLDLATSQLSVHLRFGVLSPNELYWRTEDSSLSYEEKKTFYRRLFWRDLAYYQLFCFPNMASESIRKHYDETKWADPAEEETRRFEAWKWGKTGYPIVDAGMRELYSTGWMTQSVRMVIASFLVEYLRVDWKKGLDWFHETLADADWAINAMMWQNAGRSGTDQWNFILSPVTASQDPSGEYTRKWVPELANLPRKSLHRPWETFEGDLRVAGVTLGETYPHRIVKNLREERDLSVDNVLVMRRANQKSNDDRGYDLIQLPTGELTVVFTKQEYRIDRSGQVISKTAKKTITSNRRSSPADRKRQRRVSTSKKNNDIRSYMRSKNSA